MLDPGGAAGQIGTALSAPSSGSLPVPPRAQPLARLSGGARALALEIAAESRAEWGYASDIIARAFRAHRELGSSERRQVAETVYGLIRFDRRLDAIVDEMLAAAGSGGAGSQAKARASGWAVAHSPIDFSPIVRDELKLIAFELREGLPAEAVKADVRAAGARRAGPGAGGGDLTPVWEARRERNARPSALSMPTWLVEKLAAERGEDAAAGLLDAMNQRAPLAIRVNTALTSRDKLIDELAEEGVKARPGRWTPTALVLETRVNAFGLSAFRRGLFEVMDEGSQVVAELVAPPPGGRVLDACAGAGGKTLALAAALAGQGACAGDRH